MQNLINELIELTKDWNEYDDIPLSDQIRCREIGKKINKLAGFSGMQDAYYAISQRNRFSYPLQAYWDDIGDWQY